MKTIEITIHKQNYTTPSLLAPGVVFLNFLFVIFSSFAVINLLNQVGVIASVLWLIIASFISFSALKNIYDYVSIKYFLIDVFSFYAKKEFAIIESRKSKPSIVRFGYDFFGFQAFGFSIPIDKIKEVSWSSGQATAITGEDMNDWKVCVKFDNNPPLISKEYDFHLMPTNDATSLHNEEAQKLGLEIVDFLSKGGTQLIKGKSDNIYLVK